VRRSLPLALVALALPFAVLAVAVAATLQEDPAPTPAPTPAATATPSPAASATGTPSAEPTAAPLPPAGPGLAVGVTEFNAHLISTEALPAPWAGVRDAVTAIKPAYFRLVVNWRSIQPSPDAPANLVNPETGGVGEVGPWLELGGVRAQLRALASRQAQDGWETLVVLADTPDWAAAPPSGCERETTRPRNRPPREDALPAYRRLITDVLAAAEQEGAQLRFWSAWNEPNLPPFLSPQRSRCDAGSPSLAPAVYARLARTLLQTLSDVPGDQRLVIGETAGILKSSRLVTSVPEFIRGLPEDIVCASSVYTQHAYVGGPDPVAAVGEALDRRGCREPHTIWITETGVGPAPKEYSGIVDEGAGCRALHDRLVSWYENPLVTVAFQYTVREDDKFPTGLVSTDLTTVRPALAEWIAWGGQRDRAAPPPPSAC
jgi:hypothetical protein